MHGEAYVDERKLNVNLVTILRAAFPPQTFKQAKIIPSSRI